MKKKTLHLAFRKEYPNITNTLITDVNVFDFENKRKHHFKVVLDTGATHSVITKEVVTKLNLKPTGVITVYGVNNKKNCCTYLINLGLPNGLMIPDFNVAEVEAVGADSNLIIGMDIICAGDLSISNYEKTVFCYSFPAHRKHLDLVEIANKINRKNKLAK